MRYVRTPPVTALFPVMDGSPFVGGPGERPLGLTEQRRANESNPAIYRLPVSGPGT